MNQKRHSIASIIFILCFICILVTPMAGQTTAIQQKPVEQDSSTSMFYWNKEHDLSKWLDDNEELITNGDVCSLMYSWQFPNNTRGSSLVSIVSFITNPNDQEDVIKVISGSASRSGLDVNLDVKYSAADKQCTYLQIALSFGLSPDDGENGASAETCRNKNWGSLVVKKKVHAGDAMYSFAFSCQNGKQFLDSWRRVERKGGAPR